MVCYCWSRGSGAIVRPSWVFHGSDNFSRGYFVSSKFCPIFFSSGNFVSPKHFLVGISWIQTFFSLVFHKSNIFFSSVFRGSKIYLAPRVTVPERLLTLWTQDINLTYIRRSEEALDAF